MVAEDGLAELQVGHGVRQNFTSETLQASEPLHSAAESHPAGGGRGVGVKVQYRSSCSLTFAPLPLDGLESQMFDLLMSERKESNAVVSAE